MWRWSPFLARSIGGNSGMSHNTLQCFQDRSRIYRSTSSSKPSCLLSDAPSKSALSQGPCAQIAQDTSALNDPSLATVKCCLADANTPSAGIALSPLARRAVPRTDAPEHGHGEPDTIHSSHPCLANQKSLDDLRNFLSESNVERPNPGWASANTIKSLYTSVRFRHQLSLLSSENISSLLHLLASLSIIPYHAVSRTPAPITWTRDSIHTHPLVSVMNQSSFRSHRSFVLQLAADILSQNHEFSRGDHYWLMHIQISHLDSVDVNNTRDVKRILDRVHYHYSCISRSSNHADLHVPYLKTMMAAGRLSEAVSAFCDIFHRHTWCSPLVIALLWQIIPRVSSTEQKSKLLDAISRRMLRITKFPDLDSDRPAVYLSVHLRRPSGAAKVSDMTAIVASALNSQKLTLSLDVRAFRDVQDWALREGCCLIRPCSPIAAWHSLILLATSIHPEASVDIKSEATPSCSASPEWQVVCAMAALERKFSFRPIGESSMSENPQHGAHRLVRDLWTLWSSRKTSYNTTTSSTNDNTVNHIVLASFLRFSMIIQDSELRDACHREIVIMLRHRAITEKGTSPEFLALAKYWILATYYFDAVYTDDIRQAFLGHTSDKEAVNTVTLAIEEAMRWNPLLGHRIMIDAMRAGLTIPSRVLRSVAVRLLPGHLELAAGCLASPYLDRLHAASILQACLRHITLRRIRLLPSQVKATLVRAMNQTYATVPPPSRRRWLIYALLVLLASQFIAQVVAVVAMIHKAHPTYFRERFWEPFLRTLIARRQFRRAVFMITLARDAHPKCYPRWRTMLMQGLLRRNAAPRVALAFLRRSGQGNDKDRWWSALAKATGLHPRVASLHLTRTLNSTKQPSPEQFTQALQRLLLAQRRTAARALYRRAQDTIHNQHHNVAMANAVLHSEVMNSKVANMRHIRGVLSTLDRLVTDEGFVPDRVTVNILLKAVLRWPTLMDVTRLRQLFDRLALKGYLGPACRRSVFSTAQPARDLPLPADLPAEVSFSKHARPIYRMFIKAFYRRHCHAEARTLVGMLKVAERQNQLGRQS